MSCRRLRRELVELVRFGEIDSRSAPHLEHLAGCRECRDEVGFDRALVQRLRIVMAERVGDPSPSAAAWPVILARAQARDGGLRGWLRTHAVTLVGRLRTATAISAMAVAALLLVRTDVEIRPVESAPPPWTANEALARYDPGHGLAFMAWTGGPWTGSEVYLPRASSQHAGQTANGRGASAQLTSLHRGSPLAQGDGAAPATVPGASEPDEAAQPAAPQPVPTPIGRPL